MTSTQDSKLIGDRPLRLAKGPSVQQIMFSQYGDSTVLFTARSMILTVKVRGVEYAKNDDDCLKIKGIFWIEPNPQNTSLCEIDFWPKTRNGIFREHVNSGQAMSMKSLLKLPIGELEASIEASKRLSLLAKQQWDGYIATLDPHQQLILEAHLAHHLAAAPTISRMSHELETLLRKRE